jgi:hypothetical protein
MRRLLVLHGLKLPEHGRQLIFDEDARRRDREKGVALLRHFHGGHRFGLTGLGILIAESG